MSDLPSRRHPFKSSHFHDIFRAQPGPPFPTSQTPPDDQTAETKKRSSRLPLFGRSRKKSTHSNSDIAQKPSGLQSGRASTTITRHERPSLQTHASTSQPSLLTISAAQNTLGSKIVAHLTPRKSRKHKSEPSLSQSEDGVSDAPSVPPITTPAPSIRPSTESTYSQSRIRQGGAPLPRNPPQPTITVSLPDSDDLSEYEDLFTKPRQKAKSKLAPLQIPPPSLPLRTARDRIRDSNASSTTSSSLTPSTSSPNDTDPPDLVFANEGGTGHSSANTTPTPETPTPTIPVDGFPPSSADLEAASATSADNTVTGPALTEKASRNDTVTLTVEKSKNHQRPSSSSTSRTISKHQHPNPNPRPHPSSRVSGTRAPRPAATSDTEFYAGGYSTAEESDAMSVMSMPALGGSGSFGRGRKANYQTSSSNNRQSSSPTPSRARNVSLHAFGPSSKPPTIPLPPPPPNGARARPRANTILTLSTSTSTSSQPSTLSSTSVSTSGNIPVTLTGAGLKRNNSASPKLLLSVSSSPSPPPPPPKDDAEAGDVAAHSGPVPSSSSVPSPTPEGQTTSASASSGSSSNTSSDVPNQTRLSTQSSSSGSSSRSGSSGSGSSTQTLTLIPEIQPLDINLDTASADELRLALRQRERQLANLAKYLRNVMEIHAQEKEGLEKQIADLERERDGLGARSRARSPLGAPTPDLEKDDSSVNSSVTRLPTPSPSIRLPIYRRMQIDEIDSGGESYTSAGSGAEGSGTSGAESQLFPMSSKPRRAMKKLRLVEHFHNTQTSTYRPSSTSSFYSTSSSGSGSASSPFSSPVSVTFPSALAGVGIGGSTLSSIPEAQTPPSPTFPRPHTTSGALSHSAKDKKERERDKERERKVSTSTANKPKPSTAPPSTTSSTSCRLTPSEAYARNLRKDRPPSIAQVLGGSSANKQSSSTHQNQNQSQDNRIMQESFGGRSRVLLGLVPSKKST